MENVNFKSERISKTATINVQSDIDVVFPLFGAFEERKWAEGWDPVLLFPSKEIMEEGTTFKTSGHSHTEGEFVWIVSKYDPQNAKVEYLVFTANRYWTINVQCRPVSERMTAVTVTYTFTGLNHEGNSNNRQALDKMYQHGLKDWEQALNYYLNSGKLLTH